MPKELLPKEKATHAEVEYVRPSQRAGQYCGNCEHLIEPAKGDARCQTVKNPIFLNGWCVRYEKK